MEEFVLLFKYVGLPSLGRPALDDAESTGQGRDVVILNFAASMSSPEPEHVEDTEVIEKDMIISLSNDPGMYFVFVLFRCDRQCRL